MENKLQEIWGKEYMNHIPEEIKQRGYCYSINNLQKDILITGINPSFRVDAENGNGSFDFQEILKQSKFDRYWSSLINMLIDAENGINLTKSTAYLDLFYFRETNQQFLKKNILTTNHGVHFIIDQLTVTQNTIETVIQPKLTVVKNRESSAYWGKLHDKNIIWMGYKTELIESNISGELHRIVGFLNSSERINSQIKESNILNSLIFFTQHFQYMPKIKKPNAMLLKEFLNRY